MDACGWGGGGQAPCGHPHRKLKLESTDVILSSSHAKKLVFSSFDWRVFGMHSSVNGLVVAVVWPPKNLRSGEVTLGRKRLCTTDLGLTCHTLLQNKIMTDENEAKFSVCSYRSFLVCNYHLGPRRDLYRMKCGIKHKGRL